MAHTRPTAGKYQTPTEKYHVPRSLIKIINKTLNPDFLYILQFCYVSSLPLIIAPTEGED